jgi:hypothetical protein
MSHRTLYGGSQSSRREFLAPQIAALFRLASACGGHVSSLRPEPLSGRGASVQVRTCTSHESRTAPLHHWVVAPQCLLGATTASRVEGCQHEPVSCRRKEARLAAPLAQSPHDVPTVRIIAPGLATASHPTQHMFLLAPPAGHSSRARRPSPQCPAMRM